MVVRVMVKMVKSHGAAGALLLDEGTVELRPLSPGVAGDALRGTQDVRLRVEDGESDVQEVAPGLWSVRVKPLGDLYSWASWQVELTDDMDQPVNLALHAPVVEVDGEKWARGMPGPAGASVTGARDNGDGTVAFTLSDGTETDPVPMPPGPAGRGITAVSDPDEDSRVTITYTDGTVSTVQAVQGAPGDDGRTPVITWEGTALVIDGETGPDLKGDPGADSTVPGPAPSVEWSGTRLIVGGETGPDLRGPQGIPGAKGDPGDLGSTLIYGIGRPDSASSMTPETAAAVAAAQSGAEFISTDGAGVGAWKWQKLGSTWTVTVGDTGWISLPTQPAITGGDVQVRRTQAEAYLRVLGDEYGRFRLTIDGKTSVSMLTTNGVPPGWRFSGQEVSDITRSSDGGRVAQANLTGVDNGNTLVAVVLSPAPSGTVQVRSQTFRWPPHDPWPWTVPS